MPFAPSCLVGLFCWCSEIPWSGEIRERIRTRAPPKRRLCRNCCLAVVGASAACQERFSDLVRIPSLPGSYGRSRPHGSRSPGGPPHRVARAEFDGNGLCTRIAGSSRRRYRLLRLPRGRAEKSQGRRRNQPKFGTDCGFASRYRSRDQSLQPSRDRAFAGRLGNLFLRHRPSQRLGNHHFFEKTSRFTGPSRRTPTAPPPLPAPPPFFPTTPSR